MAPFNRPYAIFNWLLIVIMALSCIILSYLALNVSQTATDTARVTMEDE